MESHKKINERTSRAELNIIVALGTQILSLICGFIIPGLLIRTYGSEAYGATTSIAQFLAYITLLEGGVGGVARSALYEPIAKNNIKQISEILNEVRIFFRRIAYIYIIYVVLLSLSFYKLSNITCMNHISTIMLVLVISISTFAQYFIGISYQLLIQADQKIYITNIINALTTVLNTVLIALLVLGGYNLIFVKLISSFVFTLRPLLMWLYVRKNYSIEKSANRNEDALSSKWTALGQHIAFFIHSNTDIAVLTIISNLSSVAVYSVYNMIISSIQNITSSFSAGMEAVFGEMLANHEYSKLQNVFSLYETIISFFTIMFFGITAVMIVPFVSIYTKGVNDANYIVPLFAVLLIISSVIFCLRLPYHALIIASGKFKETKIAAYGEAVLNLGISIILVNKFGLIGVAVGTVVATFFRFFFYAIYLSNNIINRKFTRFLKRNTINFITFIIIYIIGNFFLKNVEISSYVLWIYNALFITILAFCITLISITIFYYSDMVHLVNRLFRKTL